MPRSTVELRAMRKGPIRSVRSGVNLSARKDWRRAKAPGLLTSKSTKPTRGGSVFPSRQLPLRERVQAFPDD